MRNLLWVTLVMVGTGLAVVAGGQATAQAAAPAVNACGCYRDAAGSCFCGKKGKCDCPGDCEPRGCEEKRIKEIEKEVQAETKRARDVDKKQRDDESDRKRKAEAAANEELQAESASDAADEKSEEGGGDEGSKAKKSKKGKKTKRGQVADDSNKN